MLTPNRAVAQAEVQPWGNITGIRSHGQLYAFESSLRVISANGKKIAATAKEMQSPTYNRRAGSQIVLTRIDSLFFGQTVTEDGTGKIKVALQVIAKKDTTLTGVFFCLTLPAAEYGLSKQMLSGVKEDSVRSDAAAVANSFVNKRVKSVEFGAATRKLKLSFDSAELILVRKDSLGNLQLYLPLALNAVGRGDIIEKTFSIKVSGDIDNLPVELAVNTAQPGREFAGLGGNFRLQNPKTDPQVIDYSLQNLRVAWGRVEMPWRFWQPDKDADPIAAANDGKLNPFVLKSMQMAQRLDSMGVPVILSAWSAPNWAIVGPPKLRPGPDGIWGNPLDHSRDQAIYKSITDYILYVKAKYGFEYKLFSFNESDLGINIRLTGEEHRDFIKGLGAYMASKGLQTKLLLGDNSDANTYSFIYPAIADPATRPYIGAISFHSWRGWDNETLGKWADAATKTNLPLIVGEGSIDAAAWNYPDIFQEQTYALEEINLYVRLLAICQPESILQWQLTADYSPLIGGGIFGNKEPLHPGQRFWNLKQLANTPAGLQSMPVSVSRPGISAAALGDNSKGIYTIHLVNNGSTRQVSLIGLPAKVTKLRYFITKRKTNRKTNLKEAHALELKDGAFKFKLPAVSYVSLISE
ncbi:hypothetical protein [Mucilaginibacter psychrotolerans]|uniref:Uncharacterized protein n=1 Tax=Mucilaginibacter psychrotolerans TaxID=1524096 RepID=A0A4Y8SLU4_9SPHI|nr:hypothetical protein [Mucilaginibacter psychrotolerans]TFF39640.1 hypothetical protein E2R66_04540 [Mucilaginibacter psychrotolerans]